MSDRLAVFNQRPDRAGRRPGRGLRATRRRASWPASSARPTCSGRRRRGDPRRRAARSRSGRRRSTSPSRTRRSAPDERRATGRSATSSTSAPTPATSWRSTRARARRHPAEPGDDLDRGARTARQGCPPACGSDSTTPRRGRGVIRRRRTGMRSHATWRSPRAARRRGRMFERGASAAPSPLASAAAPSAAPSAAARRRRAEPRPASLGEGEGALNLVAWAGYVVGGTGGEQVAGLRLGHARSRQRPAARSTSRSDVDSANMVQLMKTGEYDGVSASGDATLRLIAGGDVAPVNIDLIPNYKDVFDGLKSQPTTRSTASATACPHGRGANVLMYDPTVVTTAPGQLERRLRRRLAVQGQGHGLRLRDLHRRRGALPDEDQARLGINDPYALDEAQFEAAVDLLKAAARH